MRWNTAGTIANIRKVGPVVPRAVALARDALPRQRLDRDSETRRSSREIGDALRLWLVECDWKIGTFLGKTTEPVAQDRAADIILAVSHATSGRAASHQLPGAKHHVCVRPSIAPDCDRLTDRRSRRICACRQGCIIGCVSPLGPFLRVCLSASGRGLLMGGNASPYKALRARWLISASLGLSNVRGASRSLNTGKRGSHPVIFVRVTGR